MFFACRDLFIMTHYIAVFVFLQPLTVEMIKIYRNVKKYRGFCR